jgi:hypothetical protein
MPITDQQRAHGRRAGDIDTVYSPVGCFRCLNTGYVGRRAIFEMLNTNEDLRDALIRNPTSAEIQKALAGHQFQKLQVSAYELVAAGEVSLRRSGPRGGAVERSAGVMPAVRLRERSSFHRLGSARIFSTISGVTHSVIRPVSTSTSPRHR